MNTKMKFSPLVALGDRLRHGSANTLLLGSLALALAACSDGQLPPGAQLEISPESVDYQVAVQTNADGVCLINEQAYVDIPLVLRLHDGDGSPVGDAEVRVYVDFGANTFSGFPVLALYEDRNGNGVIDAAGELVSGFEDDIATVRTDRYDGSSQLMLRVNLSCDYRGTVYAISGGVVASASIGVSDVSADAPDPMDDSGEAS